MLTTTYKQADHLTEQPLSEVTLHCYRVAENFRWTKILPSPATFVLQNYKFFANTVKVTICTMYLLMTKIR